MPVVFSRICGKQPFIDFESYNYAVIADGVTRKLHSCSVRPLEKPVKLVGRLKEHAEPVGITLVRLDHRACVSVEGAVGKSTDAGDVPQFFVFHEARDVFRVITAFGSEHRLCLGFEFIAVISEKPQRFIVVFCVNSRYTVGNGVVVYAVVSLKQFLVGKEVYQVVRDFHESRVGHKSCRLAVSVSFDAVYGRVKVHDFDSHAVESERVSIVVVKHDRVLGGDAVQLFSRRKSFFRDILILKLCGEDPFTLFDAAGVFSHAG